jgi:hypothetical protein
MRAVTVDVFVKRKHVIISASANSNIREIKSLIPQEALSVSCQKFEILFRGEILEDDERLDEIGFFRVNVSPVLIVVSYPVWRWSCQKNLEIEAAAAMGSCQRLRGVQVQYLTWAIRVEHVLNFVEEFQKVDWSAFMSIMMQFMGTRWSMDIVGVCRAFNFLAIGFLAFYESAEASCLEVREADSILKSSRAWVEASIRLPKDLLASLRLSLAVLIKKDMNGVEVMVDELSKIADKIEAKGKVGRRGRELACEYALMILSAQASMSGVDGEAFRACGDIVVDVVRLLVQITADQKGRFESLIDWNLMARTDRLMKDVRALGEFCAELRGELLWTVCKGLKCDTDSWSCVKTELEEPIAAVFGNVSGLNFCQFVPRVAEAVEAAKNIASTRYDFLALKRDLERAADSLNGRIEAQLKVASDMRVSFARVHRVLPAFIPRSEIPAGWVSATPGAPNLRISVTLADEVSERSNDRISLFRGDGPLIKEAAPDAESFYHGTGSLGPATAKGIMKEVVGNLGAGAVRVVDDHGEMKLGFLLGSKKGDHNGYFGVDAMQETANAWGTQATNANSAGLLSLCGCDAGELTSDVAKGDVDGRIAYLSGIPGEGSSWALMASFDGVKFYYAATDAIRRVTQLLKCSRAGAWMTIESAVGLVNADGSYGSCLRLFGDDRLRRLPVSFFGFPSLSYSEPLQCIRADMWYVIPTRLMISPAVVDNQWKDSGKPFVYMHLDLDLARMCEAQRQMNDSQLSSSPDGATAERKRTLGGRSVPLQSIFIATARRLVLEDGVAMQLWASGKCEKSVDVSAADICKYSDEILSILRERRPVVGVAREAFLGLVSLRGYHACNALKNVFAFLDRLGM